MPSIIHFEIHAENVERAIRFYTDTFGWKIEKWEGPAEAPDYYLITTKAEGEAGINGGLLEREGPSPKGDEPVRAFVCTIDVDSVDEYMKKIESNGGKVTTDKMAVTGMGWMCYANDPEGNLFGIMENDQMAA